MQTHEAYRVLVIDDSPDMHEVIRKILATDDSQARPLAQVEKEIHGTPAPERLMPRFEIDCAHQGQDGLTHVTRARAAGRPYSVAFVDGRMPPGWDGIETIGHLWDADPALEIVLLTGFSDYSLQEIARQLQRMEQLLVLKKPFAGIEVQQMALALSEKWRLARDAQWYFDNLEQLVKARTAELQHSLSLIQASENQYRLLFESNPTPILTYDDTTLAFISVNEAAAQRYGYSKEEFLNLTLRDLALPEDLPLFLDKLSKLPDGAGHSGVWRHRAKNDKFIEMEITSHHIARQKIFLSLAVDVTERLSLEAQLRQSQKMESIGQLAGGIAHDFNNLLTVINGHASLLIAVEKLTPEGTESLKEIVEAGKRAGALTRQLMTFSRKQEFHPQVVDLNEVVNNITEDAAAHPGRGRGFAGRFFARSAFHHGGFGHDRTSPAQSGRQFARRHAARRATDRPDLRRRHRSRGGAAQSGGGARPFCLPDLQRYRLRHRAGESGPDLRAVFHHQRVGPRHRPGLGDRLWHYQAAPRLDRRAKPTG